MEITKELVEKCNDLTQENSTIIVQEGIIKLVIDNLYTKDPCNHCIVNNSGLCYMTKCLTNPGYHWELFEGDQIIIHYEVVKDNKFVGGCDLLPGWIVAFSGTFENFKKYIQVSINFYLNCAKEDNLNYPVVFDTNYILIYNKLEQSE